MRALILLALMLLAGTARPEAYDHADWDRLLQAHVRAIPPGHETRVDYAGFQRDRVALDATLDRLAGVRRADFDRWPRADRLAFLINAYNAWTVARVLERYPALQSFKDLGSWLRSPWKQPVARLFGTTLTLDDIEHGLIRAPGAYAEPRIHFALNCASVGCPALLATAYRSAELDRQLDFATRNFLADRSRNRWRDGALEISSIFKWYRGDFHPPGQPGAGLHGFLAAHAAALDLPPAAARDLAAGTLPLRFLDYDWTLNAAR